jgi:hypothetical protein
MNPPEEKHIDLLAVIGDRRQVREMIEENNDKRAVTLFNPQKTQGQTLYRYVVT